MNFKGQLISKGLFGTYPQFSQKMNEKIRLYYYDSSGRLVFVRFLGEIKDKKRHFEINWPLKEGGAWSSSAWWGSSKKLW